MNGPTQSEINDYMVMLLKIWEKTPADQSAVFNDNRICENTQWDAKKVRAIREHCSTLGLVRYQFEGAKDYTLTPAGLDSARGSRRTQILASPKPF